MHQLSDVQARQDVIRSGHGGAQNKRMDKAIEGMNEGVRRKVIPPGDNAVFNSNRGVNSVGGQNATQKGELNTNKTNTVLTFPFPPSAKLPPDERTVDSPFASTEIQEERDPMLQNGQD